MSFTSEKVEVANEGLYLVVGVLNHFGERGYFLQFEECVQASASGLLGGGRTSAISTISTGRWCREDNHQVEAWDARRRGLIVTIGTTTGRRWGSLVVA